MRKKVELSEMSEKAFKKSSTVGKGCGYNRNQGTVIEIRGLTGQGVVMLDFFRH